VFRQHAAPAGETQPQPLGRPAQPPLSFSFTFFLFYFSVGLLGRPLSPYILFSSAIPEIFSHYPEVPRSRFGCVYCLWAFTSLAFPLLESTWFGVGIPWRFVFLSPLLSPHEASGHFRGVISSLGIVPPLPHLGGEVMGDAPIERGCVSTVDSLQRVVLFF